MDMKYFFSVLFIALGLSAVSKAQICPNEWTYYEDSCYNLGTDPMTWADAEEVCRIFDSDLVVVETAEENEFLKRLLTNHHSTSHVWIGATDVFNEGQFMWLGTFENVAFTDWTAGEPNHYYGANTEDCVQMRSEFNWGWNDETCIQPNYFVCEMKMDKSGAGVG